MSIYSNIIFILATSIIVGIVLATIVSLIVWSVKKKSLNGKIYAAIWVIIFVSVPILALLVFYIPYLLM